MPIASFTYAGSSLIMEYLFQGIPMATTTPWMGIGLTNGTKQNFQEMTGAGYQRVELDSTYFSAPTTGSVSLIKDVVFPKSLGYTGQVFSIGLFASQSASSPFAWADCVDKEWIKLNDQLTVLAGGFTHSFLTTSHFSLWLQNAILNHFYRGISLDFSATQLEVGYTTTAPSLTTIGIEPVGNNYSRKIIERNSANFRTSDFASQELTLDVGFDIISGSQGTISHLQYFIDGRYIMFSPLPTPVSLTVVEGASYPNLVLQSGSLYSLDA